MMSFRKFLSEQVSYKKGPLGWSVVKDGKPVGSIKLAGTGAGANRYLVNIEGFRPGTNGWAGRGANAFPTLAAAKKKVEEVLQ